MNWLAKLPRALARGLGELSPNCKQSVRLQSAALDTKLSFRQRVGLGIHLAICKWCRRYGKQIRFLRRAAREHGNEEPVLPQGSLSSEAGQRIRERLRQEKKR